jgi:hypothetical protein
MRRKKMFDDPNRQEPSWDKSCCSGVSRQTVKSSGRARLATFPLLLTCKTALCGLIALFG